MKFFLKIKRIRVFDTKKEQVVVFSMRNGTDIIKKDNDYVCHQTGVIHEPLYDEDTQEIIGFVDA